MAIYDIFTDASVDKSLRGTCAGAITIAREYEEIVLEKYAIQPNGTNNSGEICAIWLGVLQAYNISKPGDVVNLFSDSLISLKGVRDWIFNWIQLKEGNILIKGDKNPVLNQNYHKLIFNTIILHGLRINFYHIRGHMEGKRTGMSTLINSFSNENKVPISSIGDANYIMYYNDKIDFITRKHLTEYNKSGTLLHDTFIENLYTYDFKDFPIITENGAVERYRYLIGKTKIRPDII